MGGKWKIGERDSRKIKEKRRFGISSEKKVKEERRKAGMENPKE